MDEYREWACQKSGEVTMRRRSGFTLVELMVVIVILLILSTLVFAVFRGNSTDKTRSAARIAQSAFLGAKDRALHAKDLRGVRLTRDTTDPTLVNGFVYLQALAPLTYPPGSFQLERPDQSPQDGVADSSDILIVHGNSLPTTPAVDWDAKAQFFAIPGRIRIPSGSGGQWYTFSWTTTGVYALGPSSEFLQLQTPYIQTSGSLPFPNVVAFNSANNSNLSCDIQLGNDVLPFHQPIPLSSGVVIDLKFCSTNVRTLAGIATGTNYFVDIMFSPRGSVTGYLSGLGPLHFLLRDLKDATAGLNPLAVGAPGTANPDLSTGDRLILTVFPQTGLVQVFEIDPTDRLTNGTAAGPPDGLADNLFNFAQQ